MTRYQQIADVAVPRMREFYDERETVSEFARQLVLGYREYLEAPDDSASFVELNANLDIVGERVAIIQDAPPVQRKDGSWTFCFAMTFENKNSPYFSVENRKVNVRVQQEELVITCGKEFAVKRSSTYELAEVFDYFFENTRQCYREKKVSNRIGFYVGN